MKISYRAARLIVGVRHSQDEGAPPYLLVRLSYWRGRCAVSPCPWGRFWPFRSTMCPILPHVSWFGIARFIDTPPAVACWPLGHIACRTDGSFRVLYR